MSTGWSLWVIIGTIGTMAGALWLLLANRYEAEGTPETTGHEADGIEELNNPLPFWWVGLFVVSVAFGALYLVWYPGLGNFPGIGGWSSDEQWRAEVDTMDARFAPLYADLAARPVDELITDRTAMQIGRRLYVNNCSTCHGLTATGKFGFPNLTDNEWQWGGDFDAIRTSIANGRTGMMPGWGSVIGERGVQDTTQYVLSLAGRNVNAAAAARGGPLYATYCLACHSADGRGNKALGAPDITNDNWLYGGDADQIAFTIRHGRTGEMPAFTHILGTDRAHLVAAYIYSLNKARASN
jgi:cytochrome c oxidase cbb3-type subunit III